LGSVIMTCKGEFIVSYDEADELVVYDMDVKKIVYRLRKPQNPLLLEDVLEGLDPWVIVSEYISPEVSEVLRDMGVKIELTKKREVREFVAEVFA